MTMESDYIFSSVPVPASVTSENLCAVRDLLCGEPGRFFTAREIARRVGLPVRGTQVEVRKVVKILQAARLPIVSHARGFAWATGAGMVRACLSRELARLRGLQRSVRDLREILDGMGGQVTLDQMQKED